MPSSRLLNLMIYPGEHLTIKGKVRPDRVLEYTAEGSPLMEDFTRFRTQALPLLLRSDSAEIALIDAEQRNAPAEEMNRITRQGRESYDKITQANMAYVRAHPDRMMAGFAAMGVPIDSFPAYYALLSEEVKTGPLKSKLDQVLTMAEEEQARLDRFLGLPAPDFTLTDIDGKPFTLSAYDPEGKYTILDFWGSWCGPCIGGMPEMEKVYEKYADKLEILGIACRDKEADWKKAVAEHRLPWLHVINDASSAENDAVKLYEVKAFPTKIILSPDKKIVLVYEGEGGDFYDKLDELLND
jgi:thiol-disulfide isomerase/thioredoxin